MNSTKKQNKTVLLDASSAILLAKAGFHEIVTEGYTSLMSDSVFHEITRTSLPGSGEYLQLLQAGKVTVVPVVNAPKWCAADESLQKLDRGERDTILLFYEGCTDFVVTDDGAAAKYCLHNKVPFVNSLLLLRLLYQSGLIVDSLYEKGLKSLITLGWYSEKVKEYVRSCPDSELLFFLP